MSYIIAGLGNPGEEYEGTRHNTGRIVLGVVRSKLPVKKNFTDWREDKKLKALVCEGEVGKQKVTLIEPNNFMNNSGGSLKPIITNKKKAAELVVIYDDLDLPLGVMKISFNRGSGGHKGLESIMKAVKTPEFTRIRIGICQSTPSGKLKKPKGDKDVVDFIIKPFKPAELDVIKKVGKRVAEAIEVILSDGLQKAMSTCNG
ncbi:MAG: aminoacyl-tRNA hydrolase [Candidatus Paceibacterota bacterium]|jgi:PTH1 family peptidyl-tRNA hydrolase